MGMDKMVGKIVRKVEVSEDGNYLRFTCDDGVRYYFAEGD